MTEAGTLMAVHVDAHTATRYLELHDIIPDSLPDWPAEDLDELIDELDPGDPSTFERTLILLAHHKSPRAVDLVREIAADLPEELVCFAELAYAEAIGWLGYNYISDGDGPPTIEASPLLAAS